MDVVSVGGLVTFNIDGPAKSSSSFN